MSGGGLPEFLQQPLIVLCRIEIAEDFGRLDGNFQHLRGVSSEVLVQASIRWKRPDGADMFPTHQCRMSALSAMSWHKNGVLSVCTFCRQQLLND